MRFARAALALPFCACSLLTSLDGLQGGSPDASDAGPSADVASDGPSDASSDDVADANDAGSDAASCGFPGPTQGLIAYYPFEEGQGQIVHDCSPNHLDGTFVQQPTGAWTTGKFGGGIRVQASDGCVDLGTASAFQSPTMTLAAWIQINAFAGVGSSGYVLGQSFNADVDGWRAGTRTTDAGPLLGWESSHDLLDTTGPSLSVWHHVAMTFASGTVQIYVDGALAQSRSGFSAIVFDSAPIRIGCRADGNNAFDGWIDEVRLYARALSQSEITSLAQ